MYAALYIQLVGLVDSVRESLNPKPGSEWSVWVWVEAQVVAGMLPAFFLVRMEVFPPNV